jgi:hypothetical protein
MRFAALALVILCPALAYARDSRPIAGNSVPDPLAVLLTDYALPPDEAAAKLPAPVPGSGEGLARARAELTLLTEGLEAFRDPAQAKAAFAALPKDLPPELKKHFKDRDSALEALYRTLSVVDYTWALRSQGACPADKLRSMLIFSSAGLLSGNGDKATPWLLKLLGETDEGLTAEAALDRASSEFPLTPAQYERLRVKARLITEALDSPRAVGAARGKLYCERAAVYGRLMLSHVPKTGPVVAGETLGGTDPADSLLLVAQTHGKHYTALGAATVVKTKAGLRVLTDASVVTDTTTGRLRPDLVAFTRPREGATGLGGPYALTLERADASGAMLAQLPPDAKVPGLTVATSSAAMMGLVKALGHMRSAGAWTETSGLVTKISKAWFQSDALLGPGLAGGPMIDDSGEMVGLVLQGGQAALEPLALRRILDGEASQAGTPDAHLAAARGTGSAAILTKASIFDQQGLTGPGAAPIEAGLPDVAGGVDWVNGGGGLPSFTPSNIPTPPSAPAYSPDDSGSSSSDVSSYDSPSDDSSSDSSSSSGDSGSSYSPSDNANYQCHAGAPCAWPYEIIGGLVKVLFKGSKLALKGAKALGHKIAEASKRKPKPVVVKPPEPKITGLTLSASPDHAKPGDTVELKAALQFQGDYKRKAGIAVTLTATGERASFVGGLKSLSLLTDNAGEATAPLTIRQLTRDSAKGAFSALDAEARGKSDLSDAAPKAPVAAAPPGASKSPEASAQTAARTAVKNAADRAFGDLDSEAAEPRDAPPPQPSDASPEPIRTGAPISVSAAVPESGAITIDAESSGYSASARIETADAPHLIFTPKNLHLDRDETKILTVALVGGSPSYNKSNRRVRITVSINGTARQIDLLTDADGKAEVRVRTYSASPIVAGRRIGGPSQTIEASNALAPTIDLFCGAMGAEAAAASSTVLLTGEIVLGPAGMAAGATITVGCLVLTQSREIFQRSIASDRADAGGATNGKADSLSGQPASPNPGEPPDGERQKRSRRRRQRLTQKDLEHIIRRHWPDSDFPDAGKFTEGTKGRDLLEYIDETVDEGASRPNTKGRPGRIFEYEFDHPIGTNGSGNLTAKLRVILRLDGTVLTAFPY